MSSNVNHKRLNGRNDPQKQQKQQQKQRSVWRKRTRGWIGILLLFVGGISSYNLMSMSTIFHPATLSNLLTTALVGYDTIVDTTESPLYTSALAILRCFVTPRCFPTANCKHGQPQKIMRKKKWEEQSFCIEDLKATKQQQGNCLVYSFGIHSSAEWESKVATLFGCDVHAFDPTQDFPRHLQPGVTFHKLGLQASGTDMSQTHAAEYDPIDPNLLLSLSDIMRHLGHDNRTLDVLMMDCEGCEWGALQNLACDSDSPRVNQILVEFHFQINLGLQHPRDVLLAADALRCLWQYRWHIASIEGSGAGPDNWQYTDGMYNVVHSSGMLVYVALQQIPEDELSPAQMLEVTTLYSHDHKKWPDEVRAAVHKNRPRGGRRPAVTFDTFARYPENDQTAIVGGAA